MFFFFFNYFYANLDHRSSSPSPSLTAAAELCPNPWFLKLWRLQTPGTRRPLSPCTRTRSPPLRSPTVLLSPMVLPLLRLQRQRLRHHHLLYLRLPNLRSRPAVRSKALNRARSFNRTKSLNQAKTKSLNRAKVGAAAG